MQRMKTPRLRRAIWRNVAIVTIQRRPQRSACSAFTSVTPVPRGSHVHNVHWLKDRLRLCYSDEIILQVVVSAKAQHNAIVRSMCGHEG